MKTRRKSNNDADPGMILVPPLSGVKSVAIQIAVQRTDGEMNSS